MQRRQDRAGRPRSRRGNDPGPLRSPHAAVAIPHPHRPHSPGKRLDRVLPYVRKAGLEPMPATCSPEELMTAAPAVSQAVGGSEGQLLTALQEIHRSWLQEIRKVLDSARRPEAGIHRRWRAVRYLNTIVSPRFEIERAGVETLGKMVEPRHVANLRLAAELMATRRQWPIGAEWWRTLLTGSAGTRSRSRPGNDSHA